MRRISMIQPGFMVAMTCIAAAGTARAGDQVSVGRAWPAAQHIAIHQVSHAPWDALLRKYVDSGGDVNYAAWKANLQDVRVLDGYLAALSQGDPRKPTQRAAQLAYWINAYNALTVRGILREYPTTSIRNHTAKVFGYNIWDDLLLTTPTGPYSLNKIEHQVLRKLQEWRIHFAIVCASKGCPRLLAEAYVPQRLDTQLTANTKNFFADPRKLDYDARTRQLNVSPILKWFATDFGGSLAQQMATIAPYLPDDASRRLAASGTAGVAYLDYDWKLNEQKRQAARQR